MKREEAEQYLFYAMTIGEMLLTSGAEVGRVEDTIRRICMAYGAKRVDVFSITSSIVTTMYGEEFGICTREFDSLGSPNASQSLIRLYFFCQFLILYFHVMLSYVIITMR